MKNRSMQNAARRTVGFINSMLRDGELYPLPMACSCYQRTQNQGGDMHKVHTECYFCGISSESSAWLA